MAIVTVGIDLAKNVFAVHGVDETGNLALVRPDVPRAKLLERIAHLPPCLIGTEVCSGAHHRAREFAKLGHTMRLMAPVGIGHCAAARSRDRTPPSAQAPGISV